MKRLKKIRVLPLTAILVLALSIPIYAQPGKPDYQSNPDLTFQQFLAGVQHAIVVLGNEDLKYMENNPTGGFARAILGITDYLEDMGFTEVWVGCANNTFTYPSLCDMAIVVPIFEQGLYGIKRFELNFFSCKGDIFKLTNEKDINIGPHTDLRKVMYKRSKKIYSYPKPQYFSNLRLKLPTIMTEWTEAQAIQYFSEGSADPIEGIYESIDNPNEPVYKMGIVKSGKGYDAFYISGSTNPDDWVEGELKAKFQLADSLNYFKTIWIPGCKIAEYAIASYNYRNGYFLISWPDGGSATLIKAKPENPDDTITDDVIPNPDLEAKNSEEGEYK